MQIKWLKDFVSLSRQRSFTRAADERQVTLPAFGRRIKALESWVGVPLINRGGYPATLTDEGELFLQTALDVLARLDEGCTALRARNMAGEGTLHVATGRTLAHTFFPALFDRVRRQLGPINVRVSTGSVHDMALLLEDGGADVLLSYFHPDIGLTLSDAEFQGCVVAADVMIPVSQPDARGRPRFSLPGTGKAPLPLLSYSPTLMMGNVLNRHLLEHAERYHVNLVLVADFAEALLEHVVQGVGIAWLPQHLAKQAIGEKRLVHAGSPADEIALEVRLYRKRKVSKPLISSLWHCLSGSGVQPPPVCAPSRVAGEVLENRLLAV
jgi:DNA-binding transcriptional LysR family regulator